jgi:hypothetical protein
LQKITKSVSSTSDPRLHLGREHRYLSKPRWRTKQNAWAKSMCILKGSCAFVNCICISQVDCIRDNLGWYFLIYSKTHTKHKTRQIRNSSTISIAEQMGALVFVERSSTKECTRQHPPSTPKTRNDYNISARARLQTLFEGACGCKKLSLEKLSQCVLCCATG